MSDQPQTIRVHQYAECSGEEARMTPHGRMRMQRLDNGAIIYTDTLLPDQPVRYLGCVEMPAPKKPKVRVVYRFEEVAEPCASEDGRWWYDTDSGPECRWGATHPLRRTVERVAVERERWNGTARVEGGQDLCRAAVRVGFVGISLTGEGRAYAEAAADLPILKNLAEQYAAAHGATIEWRDRNE